MLPAQVPATSLAQPGSDFPAALSQKRSTTVAFATLFVQGELRIVCRHSVEIASRGPVLQMGLVPGRNGLGTAMLRVGSLESYGTVRGHR